MAHSHKFLWPTLKMHLHRKPIWCTSLIVINCHNSFIGEILSLNIFIMVLNVTEMNCSKNELHIKIDFKMFYNTDIKWNEFGHLWKTNESYSTWKINKIYYQKSNALVIIFLISYISKFKSKIMMSFFICFDAYAKDVTL